MKKYLYSFILVIIMADLFAVISCRKEGDVIISDKVKLPEENPNLLNVLVRNDTLYFIYKSGASKPKFNSGDIVVGQMDGGYLKKVNSTTTKGDTLILFTTQACLTEAIQKGSIDTTFSVTPTSQQLSPLQVDSFLIGGDGKRYPYHIHSDKPLLSPQGVEFTLKFPNVSIEICDPNNNVALSILVDTIIVTMGCDIDFDLEIEDWEITHFLLTQTSTGGLNFKGISIDFVYTIPLIDENFKLHTQDLGTITFFIGPVPVVIAFELGIYVGAEATLTLSQSAEFFSEVNIGATNTVGAEYINNTWKPIWNYTLNGNADFNFSPSGSISAEVKDYLKLSLDTKLYKVAGPTLYLKPYLYDEFSYPPFTLETGGGIGAGLGFKVEILKWGLVEFNYTFLDYKKPFGQISSSPPNTPAVPSGPDSGSAGMSYTFSSSTTDPEGDNIAIRFAWGDGDTSSWSSYVPSGSTVSIAHAWTSSGTYNVKAQAKDINGLTSDWSSPHLITISSGNTVFYETFNNDPVGGNPNPNVWTVVESLPSYVEIVANGYSNNGLIFVDPTADTIPGGDSSCAWIVKSGLGTYTNIEFYVKSQSSNLHWGIRAVNEWFNYSTISWYLWFLGNGVYYAPQGHQPDSAGFVFIDNIAPNTWHKFRLVLNWGTKTYLIYIDDVLKATAPFVYNVSGGAYLQLVDFYSSWLPIDGLIVDEINLTNTFGMTVPTIRTKLPDSFNKVVGAQ